MFEGRKLNPELDIRNSPLIDTPKPKIDPEIFIRKIQQYRTLNSINEDGRVIPAGELIDLSRAEAEPLLLAGAIELVVRRFDAKIFVPGADI